MGESFVPQLRQQQHIVTSKRDSIMRRCAASALAFSLIISPELPALASAPAVARTSYPVVGVVRNFVAPKGPFGSKVATATSVLQHPRIAVGELFERPPKLAKGPRGYRDSSAPRLMTSIYRPVFGGGKRADLGLRNPLSLTLGQATYTGINTWWTYEQDMIPGLGRFMVNVGSSRNLVVQSDDFNIPHRWISAAFRRTYNSLSQHDYANTDQSTVSNFGGGWTNTFDAHLAVNTGLNGTFGITVFDTDGARYDYTPTDSTGNVLIPPAGTHAMLVPDPNKCTYYWTKPGGTAYHFRTPVTAVGKPCAVSSRFLATAGRIMHIYGRNQSAQLDFSYTWDNGNSSSANNLNTLVVAEDGVTTAATLSFTDVGSSCSPAVRFRLLYSATLMNGDTFFYKYDCSGNLVEVDKPNNFNLSACAVDGSNCIRERYAYSPGHILSAASGGVWSGSLLDPNNLASGTAGGYVVFNTAGGSLTSAQMVGVVNPTINDGYSNSPLQTTPSGVTTFRTIYVDQSAATTNWHDSDGHQTIYNFDGLNRVTSFSHWTGSLYLTATRTWDGDNNISSETDYRGNVTSFAHDLVGDTTAIAEPPVSAFINGSTQTIRPTRLYSYDSNFNTVSHCDSQWTSDHGLNWDGVSTPSACPTAPGNEGSPGPDVSLFSDQTGHGFEPFGELTDTYASNGYHTHYSYVGVQGGISGNSGLDYGTPTVISGDAFTSGTNQVAPTQTYSYDASGNIICANKGTGFGLISYDLLSRKTAVADPDDSSMSNSSCQKSPGLPGSAIVQRMSYYPNGQISSTQSPSQAAVGVSTTMTYDLDGNNKTVVKHFSGTAGTTTRWYDGYDRLVEVSQPRDTTDYYSFPWMTRYLYDLTQNGTVSIGSSSGLKAYGGMFKSQTYISPSPSGGGDPWSDTTGATFDAADRVVSTFDPGISGGTPTATNTYDQPGTLSGEEQRFGLLSQSTKGNAITSLAHYDAMGRLIEKDYTDNTPQLKIAYDPSGRLADIHIAGVGDEITTFNALGNAKTVTSPSIGVETSPTTLSYSYAPNGWRSSIGVTHGATNEPSMFNYSYRNDGRVIQQTLTWNGSTNVFQYDYTAGGRKISVTDPTTGRLVPASKSRSVRTTGNSILDAPSAVIPKFLIAHAPAPDLMSLLGFEKSARFEIKNLIEAVPAKSRLDSFIVPSTRSNFKNPSAKPKSMNRNVQIATRAHALASSSRKTTTAVVGSYVPTTYSYDSYGRLNNETLPTGYQYSNMSYDGESEVMSFSAYGDNSNVTQQVRNAYTARGELQGQHYYPNGTGQYTNTWPHFSSRNADGYNLPTGENIASSQTLNTSWSSTDDRSVTNITYDQYKNLLQGYGYQVDTSGRMTINRWEAATGQNQYLYGAQQRSYDFENRLLSWNILYQDSAHPTITLSGWPIQGPDVNLMCSGSGSNQVVLYPPGTQISYSYGPNGLVSGHTVQNVGYPAVNEQLHYDGGALLFSTDGSGAIDKVRVGEQAIILSDGSSTMYDRDFNGGLVLVHSASGYSSWQPPDPNLQNCQPSSAPASSTNYQPLLVEFLNLSSDTLTDGYNFFAGARVYDPIQSEWTAPDPAPGKRIDPMSQMPFIWNHGNPESYHDPSGFCADPGGTGDRLCFDFYIPARELGYPFNVKGDDRKAQNFESRDQDRYRVRINLDFADHSKSSFDVADSTNLKGESAPGIKIKNTFTWNGSRDVDIHVDDSCGFCHGIAWVTGIASDTHVHLNDNGSYTISGFRSQYPALEGWLYTSKGRPQMLLDDAAIGPAAFGTMRILPQIPFNSDVSWSELDLSGVAQQLDLSAFNF